MSMNDAKGNMYSFVNKTWNPIKGKCSHDCEYCLPKKTKILMADYSIKNIEDIGKGDHIIGLIEKKGFNKFGISKVIDTSKRSAKTIIIQTQDNKIECTPNHPIYGSIKRSADWRQAKWYSPYHSIRYIGLPKEYTDDLLKGWITGFCDGDGCFFNYGNQWKKDYIGFEAVCTDNFLMNQFINTCKKFDINLKKGIKKSSINSFNKGGENPLIFSRSRKEVQNLKNICLFDKNKPKDFYKGYLAGMIDTDGSVTRASIRIAQSKVANKIKYDRIIFCCKKLGLDYREEKLGIRINTNFMIKAKILFEFKPKHSLKTRNFIENLSIKGTRRSIINSITKGKACEVYNLQTECGNYIANGFIVHNCYMKVYKQKPLRLVEKELNDDLGKDNFIFVGSSTDMFAEDVDESWICDVLECCCKYPNKYLFQTKNPRKYMNFIGWFPKNYVLGTTIETNRNYPKIMGNTPIVDKRAYFMNQFHIRECKTMVTIEPILDFDLDELVKLIKMCHPEWVNIGADSKGHKLPEPSKEKVESLISELKKFTDVKIKKNLKRITHSRS